MFNSDWPYENKDLELPEGIIKNETPKVGEQKNSLNIFTLPLISDYRVLSFYGTANGTKLTQAFNIADIQDSIMVIKAFRIVPYYHANSVDLFIDDGAGTVNQETIPAGARINRLFDSFTNTALVQMLLNDVPVNIFSQDAAGGHYPLDLDIDGIYRKFNEKVQGFDIQITSTIVDDIYTGNTSNPDVKVVVECYLI